MNTELRNKLFNKIKNVFENEDTQEREAFLQAREDVDIEYVRAFALAKGIVERAYPEEDVKVLRYFKSKYGSPCDVVAKDKCFYFAHSEDKDDEGDIKETKSQGSPYFFLKVLNTATSSGGYALSTTCFASLCAMS